jgi:kynurenine 3-monooxygenase
MVCATDKVRYYEANPKEFPEYFDETFPGIVGPLISREEIQRQFVANIKIPLKSVKCGKLGYKDNAVLLVDSSHAMTPFHAMGMITGLEDVRIFVEDFRDSFAAAMSAATAADSPHFCAPGTIQAYTDFRLPDVHAMVDMAASHYHELRIRVRSTSARTKKIVEAWLRRWAPSLDWTTTYSRIQFGHGRFTVIRQKDARQSSIVSAVLTGAAVIVGGAALAGILNF